MIEISRTYEFQASHSLPNVPEGHKCKRLHGHTYRVRLTIKGNITNERLGWLVDYADMDAAWAPVYEALDHRHLNDIEGLKNPTSEVLCVWIWSKLHFSAIGEHLASIAVSENSQSWIRYYPG